MAEKILHVGIYGILKDSEKILTIRKSRGPYKNMLDLPGGRPSHGEPILDALKREIREETGIKIKSCSFFGNFSFLTPYIDPQKGASELYHIALIYHVLNADLSDYNPLIIDEDANGSVWKTWDEIQKEKSSPLLQAALENYKK